MSDIPDDIMEAARKIASDWAGAGPFTHDVAADIAQALQAAEKRGEQRERERILKAIAKRVRKADAGFELADLLKPKLPF